MLVRLLPILIFVACARPAAPAVGDASVSASASAGVEDAGTRVLEGYPWQIELEGGIGAVSIPLGAREARPIMIALHGGGDRPGWACGEWRGITNAYPFLVCPRGGAGAAYGWSHPDDTKARIARAVAATKAMFGPWIRDGVPTVLAGFSMGATQTALLAKSDPATYPRVAISESAYAPEPVRAFASSWKGARVIFSCTTVGCEPTYRNAARTVAAAHKVGARLNIAGTNQHGIWETVVSSLSRDWPWLVEGLAGWETYEPAPSAKPLPGKTEVFE